MNARIAMIGPSTAKPGTSTQCSNGTKTAIAATIHHRASACTARSVRNPAPMKRTSIVPRDERPSKTWMLTGMPNPGKTRISLAGDGANGMCDNDIPRLI